MRHVAVRLAIAFCALSVGFAVAAAEASAGVPPRVGVSVAKTAASAQITASAKARAGTLSVLVTGLPSGLSPVGYLSGPGIRERVTARQLVIRRARAGMYTLRLERVTVKRGRRALEKGAVAYPVLVRVQLRLRPGARAKLTGSYGFIINPGVVSSRARVLEVGGSAQAPSSVVLAGRARLSTRAVLSMAPNVSLPRGLLARVQAIRFGAGRTMVTLRPVSIYAVVPEAQFDIRLTAATSVPAADVFRRDLASLECGPTSRSGVYRRITNITFSGGWNTLLGTGIPIGVTANVDFDVDAGLDDFEGLDIGASCEADLSATGMAGPVPVTAAVFGQINASVGAGADFNADASIHVQAGASTVGFPPVLTWVPHVGFSHPQMKFSVTLIEQATAGIAVGVKAGLGDEDIAAATLNFTNSINFLAQPGECSLNGDFEQFSAEGKLLGWTIDTPKTPALFTENLWHNACAFSGSGGGTGGGGTGGGGTGGGTACPTHPTVSFTPSSGPLGTTFTVAGSGWLPAVYVGVGETPPNGNAPAAFTGLGGPTSPSPLTDAAGNFTVSSTVEPPAGGMPPSPGAYVLSFGQYSAGCQTYATAAFTLTTTPNEQPPMVGQTSFYTSGELVWIVIPYTDADNDAAGFGFVGVNGSGFAGESHPFSSPSYGHVYSDRVEYPFNLACGTSSQYETDISAWIWDDTGLQSTHVTTHLSCS